MKKNSRRTKNGPESFNLLNSADELNFFRLVLDNLSDCAFWMDSNGRFIYVNEASCKTLGYSRDELLKMSVSDIDPFFPIDKWDENWQRLRKDKQQVVTTAHRAKDGRIIPIEIRANFIEIDGAEFDCAFSRDLTRQNQADESARLQDELLSLTEQLGQLGSWAYDSESKHFKASHEFPRVFGAEGEPPGSLLQIIQELTLPEDRETVSSLFSESNGQFSKTEKGEFRIRRKDNGAVRVISFKSFSLKDTDGKVTRVVGVIQDITEMKNAYNEIKWRNEDLELMGMILSASQKNVSLDNIINFVTGYAERIFNSSLVSISVYDKKSSLFEAYVGSAASEFLGKIAQILGFQLPRVQFRISENHAFNEVYTAKKGVLINDEATISTRLESLLEGTLIPAEALARMKESLPAVNKYLQACSIITVPLIFSNEVIGIIDLISRDKLAPRDLQRLQSLADQLALVIARYESESNLRDSEKKYHTMFEKMAQGVVYQDANGKIIDANPAAEKILGLSLDQMTGRTSVDPRWHAIREDGSPFLGESHPAMAALSTGKENSAIMGVFNPETSEYRWINVNAVPEFRNEEKIPFRVFTSFENITPLKKLINSLDFAKQNLENTVQERTRELQKTNKFQSAILANVPVGILTSKPDGKISTANPALLRMTGYSIDELRSKKRITDLFDSELLKEAYSAKTGVSFPTDSEFREKMPFQSEGETTEWVWIKKDGTPFNVKLSHVYLRDESFAVTGSIFMVSDITMEKIVFEELKESRERFQKMFDEHSAVMLLMDPVTGDIVQANNAAKVFYGYDFTERKMKISDINLLPSDEVTGLLGKAKMHQTNYFKFQHRLASGEVRNIEAYATPIDFHEQKLIFSIIHDITERIRAEEAHSKSRAENQAIIHALPDLLFRISSDGIFLDCVTKDEAMLYRSKEMFLDKRIEEVLPPALAVQSISALQECLTTGNVVGYEYTLPIGSEIRYYENRISRISNNEVLSIVRDTTHLRKTEISLRETTRKLSFLISNLINAALFEDENRKISFTNTQFCELFNIPYSPEEIIGRNWIELTKDKETLLAEPKAFFRRLDELTESRITVLNEEVRFADGRYFEMEYMPLFLEEKFIGHLWRYRDITSRKTDENARKILGDYSASISAITNIEDALNLTLNTALQFDIIDAGGIYLMDEKTGHPRLAAHLGLSELFVKEQSMYDFSAERESLAKITEPVYTNMRDLMRDRSDNAAGAILAVAIFPLKHDDKVIGFITIASSSLTEIPEASRFYFERLAGQAGIAISRILTQEAFLAGRKNFQMLFETIDDFLFILDKQGNIIFTNPIVNERLGYTPEELRGRDVVIVHPHDRREEAGRIIRGVITGTESSCMVPLLQKDGGIIPVETRVIPGKWDGEEVLFGISRDMTEREKYENDLLTARNQAERASSAKSELLSRVSHEFRTPLNSILGFAQLLEMGDLNTSQKKSLNHILKSGRLLLELIDQVLDIAKVDSGKMPVEMESFSFNDFMSGLPDIFKPAASKKGITIHLNIQASESTFLFSDKQKLKQVLMNLMNNAIRFSNQNGNIFINAEMTDVTANGKKKVRISVKDEGIGIKEEDIGKIFQPFQKLNLLASNDEGPGLGLTAAKNLITLLGGKIGVISQPGAGSEFWIELDV